MTTVMPLLASPIEEKLYFAVRCHLKPETIITPQVEVETKRGIRRVDFMLTNGALFAAVECDGADYHTFDGDLDRDALLILAGFHAVFHFSGSFIHNHRTILAPIIASITPHFFKGDPVVECVIPTRGAFVRLAPNFPNLRDEFRDMVLDARTLTTLTTCRNLAHIQPDPNAVQIAYKHIKNLIANGITEAQL